ncbi:MAG: hypothetical protein UHU19_18045 [Lachnospiraceae bacterium]|nr:hypothetical protein [Lachnospiraceae bacterium]
MNLFSIVLLVILIAYVCCMAYAHNKVPFWGRHIALLTLLGLFICCVVATRDNYDLSVQASFDHAVTAGLFTIDSIQSKVCCICGGIIACASLSSIFVKNQKYRRFMYFAVAGTAIIKMLVIEFSRMVM